MKAENETNKIFHGIEPQRILRPVLGRGGRMICVCGCGGKTTFIKKTAAFYCKRIKTGIAASTRMYMPGADWPQGISVYRDALLPDGKIAGFSAALQKKALAECGLLLVEADGSAGRPLKGWADYEPVIPEYTAATVGILPLHVIGEKLRNEDVHRMSLFTALTGLKEGDVMTVQAMVRMILSAEGLFKSARGEKILILNHVGDRSDRAHEEQIYRLISSEHIRVFYGNMDDIDGSMLAEEITALVPASGFSRRMDGKDKLLLDWGGIPLVCRVLCNLKEAGIKDIALIAHDPAVIRAAALYAPFARIIYNDAPDSGQSRSVVCGTASSPGRKGWLFLNGDMPLTDSFAIRQVLNLAARHPQKIVRACYQGQAGQPVYFPCRFRDELLNLSGDQGGRSIINIHADAVEDAWIDDLQAGKDIDSLQDYMELKEWITEKS